MATVSDIINCPQCGAQAEYELNTRSNQESVFCFRCGYHADNESTAPGYGTYCYGPDEVHHLGGFHEPNPNALQEFEQLAADHPDLTHISVRLPPYYRTQFIRGAPEGLGDLTAEQEALLNEAFAPYGEQVHAIQGSFLYTRHPEQPGLKTFYLAQDADKAEVDTIHGEGPLITIQAGHLQLHDPIHSLIEYA